MAQCTQHAVTKKLSKDQIVSIHDPRFLGYPDSNPKIPFCSGQYPRTGIPVRGKAHRTNPTTAPREVTKKEDDFKLHNHDRCCIERRLIPGRRRPQYHYPHIGDVWSRYAERKWRFMCNPTQPMFDVAGQEAKSKMHSTNKQTILPADLQLDHRVVSRALFRPEKNLPFASPQPVSLLCMNGVFPPLPGPCTLQIFPGFHFGWHAHPFSSMSRLARIAVGCCHPTSTATEATRPFATSAPQVALIVY